MALWTERIAARGFRLAAVCLCVAMLGIRAGRSQDLTLSAEPSTASAKPGEINVVAIRLNAPDGKGASALQFELLYPSPQMGVEQDGIRIADAAQSAGKSIHCTGRPDGA